MRASVMEWDGIPAEDKLGGVVRRRIPGVLAELVRVEVPAGTRAERHAHDHEQFVQVIAGSGTLECETGVQAFGVGTVFHFAPGAWHAASFTADTILIEANLAKG